ncbi:MAG: hypothetical protein ACXAD7_21490 [Candidatus Kariarchaeaceae archaeon]
MFVLNFLTIVKIEEQPNSVKIDSIVDLVAIIAVASTEHSDTITGVGLSWHYFLKL